MRKIIATTLLLISAPAMAGTYVAPVVRVAPVPVVRVAPVHVAPVHVAPVVRAHTVVKPVTTIGRPVAHRHHQAEMRANEAWIEGMCEEVTDSRRRQFADVSSVRP